QAVRQVTRGSHRALQAAVEQRRMNSVARWVELAVQSHEGEGFACACPQPLDRAEDRAEIRAVTCKPGVVVRSHGFGRLCPHRCEQKRRAWLAGRCNTSAGVELPGFSPQAE